MAAVLRTLTAIALLAAPLAAAQPTPDALVAKAIAAAGGSDAFTALGVIELTIAEQENLIDGTVNSSSLTGYVATSSLDNQRLELPGDIVLVRNGITGWATRKGQVDTRPQSPIMAYGTVNQKLFPLLLPFSLQTPGVAVSAVTDSTFQGAPSWRASVTFPANFFTSPSMITEWSAEFAKADGRLLFVEFQPPAQFAKARDEGVRYRALRTTTVKGVTLGSEILLDGIDAHGIENGHTRIVKVKPAIRGAFDATLFVHPDKVAAFEDADIPSLP